MTEKLKNMLEEAKAQLSSASVLEDAEALRIKLLGKKGQLTEILRSMKDLAPEERKALGQAANETREKLESMIRSSEFQKYLQVSIMHSWNDYYLLYSCF